MTTQRDVIKAFVTFEDFPALASNMRVYHLSESRAILCGGRDGREAVLAEREPLRQVTVYTGRPSRRHISMQYGSFRDQQYKTRQTINALQSRDSVGRIDYTRRRNEVPEPSEYGI